MSDTTPANADPAGEGKSISTESSAEVTTEAGVQASHAEQTDVEWPEPQEDDGEEKSESLANDGTPGAAPEEE